MKDCKGYKKPIPTIPVGMQDVVAPRGILFFRVTKGSINFVLVNMLCFTNGTISNLMYIGM